MVLQNFYKLIILLQVYKVWMSAEAITDEEILTEILSEMEDDVSDSFEGEGAFEFVVLAVEINTHTKYCL